MEVKPGYKLTELGTIPANWELVRFSELMEFQNGVNASKDAYGSGVPFINVLEVITKSHLRRRDVPGLVSLSKTAIDAYSVRRGDFVFNRTSETQTEVGLAAVYMDEEAVVFGGFVIRGRPIDNRLDAAYAGYGLRAAIVRDQIVARGQGAIRSNIGQADLKQIWMPLPSSAEQHAIAEALSDTDALIHSLDRQIEKQRRLKQGAMQDLLACKKRLPGYRGEWQMRRFGEIAQPRKERIDPRVRGAQEFCIELEHIEQETGRLIGSTATSVDSSFKSVFQREDVLFGKLRAYLRKYWLATRAGLCSTEFWVLMAKRSLLIPQFLFQIVQTDRFIEVASSAYGTHMPRSDWSVVKNYEVHLPPVDEQIAIAAILSDMDAEIAATECKLAKARQIKQGMMQELLTGRVRLQ